MAKKKSKKGDPKAAPGSTSKHCGSFCGVRTATGEQCKKPCLKVRAHRGFHTCNDHRHTDPDFPV